MYAFFENRQDGFLAQDTHGLTFPFHLHPHLELFLALSGETTVTVRKRTEILTPGCLAVIFPNQIHSYTAHTPESRATLIVSELSRTGGYADTLLRHHPADPFLRPEALHPNVGFAIGEMAAEQKLNGDGAVYAPLMQLILARTLPLLSLHRNRSADYEELTYQIAQQVNERFREPLTLETLARELGVSKFHLSHVFSEKFSQNFPAYLSNIRLACACGMLADTARPVTEVAEESGFESQRTFYRVFRERYHMTPLEYRRDAQGAKGGLR